MIEYFKNNAKGTIIYRNKAIVQEKYNSLTYINKLCLNHLFSYDGYKRSVYKNFNKRNLVPLVLNSELVLLPINRTRNYDNIWLNIKAVKKVMQIDKNIVITFYSNRELIINMSLSFYFKQVDLAKLIEIEKSKHFH